MFLWLAFAEFLFIACAILLVLEIFVPSFGLLTIMALGSLAGGIVIFFNHGPTCGWIGIINAFILIPFVWIITYKVLPKTSFGKKITLGEPDREKGDAIPDTNELEKMKGREGIVLTPLRPVGMCDFDGHRLECVAETGYVEKNNIVKVIHVEGTQLTVRLSNNKERENK